VLQYLRSFWEDFKAFRRGERRVAPRSCHRGRIYAPRNLIPESSSGGIGFNVKRAPQATLTMRITRLDGTVETHVVPATATVLQ